MAMRFLAFLLAFFILYLAIKPGIDSLSLLAASEQTCCGDKCMPTTNNNKAENKEKNDDCEDKACNPFQVCSACVLVCLNIHVDVVPKPTTYSTKRFNYQLTFTSQFAPEFWQPPKIG